MYSVIVQYYNVQYYRPRAFIMYSVIVRAFIMYSIIVPRAFIMYSIIAQYYNVQYYRPRAFMMYSVIVPIVKPSRKI